MSNETPATTTAINTNILTRIIGGTIYYLTIPPGHENDFPIVSDNGAQWRDGVLHPWSKLENANGR